MIEYKVKVYPSGTKEWWFNNRRHRENGPAIEFTNATPRWFLNGIEYSEKEYWEKLNSTKQSSCDGKVVEIDGKRYKLQEV